MRKKNIPRVIERFERELQDIDSFLASTTSLSKQHRSWAYEHGVIRLYRSFETMMLETLVAVMNKDMKTVSERLGVRLPKHLTDEACQYLVTGGGYFDFRGREGLLKKLQQFLPKSHSLVKTIKKHEYKTALERLVTLRNFAAHGSAQSKKAAKDSTGQTKIGSAGAWLKRQKRFGLIEETLRKLAKDIRTTARSVGK